MKTNYTDEQIQAAIDAAFREATSLVKLSAIYRSSAWEDEKADRLDVAKILLARLPEPPPPLIKFQREISTLRPIAEAGEVPAGSVRVFASKLDGWKPKTYQITADTHFADIRLPDAKAPAVEDAKPVYVGYATDEMPTIAELKAAHTAGKVIQHLQDGVWWDFIDPSGTAYSDPPKYYRIKPADTFNAHGKTWNRHTPGDPMPCGANDEIHILCQTIEAYSPEIIQAGEDVDWRSADLNLAVIGWRYADEPTPAEPLKPWTPAVGDVVTLKSGGPKMTAVKAAPELHFWCNWFDGAERHEGCFPTATLQPA